MMSRTRLSRAEQKAAYRAEGDKVMLRFVSAAIDTGPEVFVDPVRFLADVPAQAKYLMGEQFLLHEYKYTHAAVRADCLVVGAYRDMLQILRGPYKTLSPEDIIHLTTDDKTIATIALMARRKTFEFAKLITDMNTQGAYVQLQDGSLQIERSLPPSHSGEGAGCPHRESPLFGKFIAHVGQIAAVAAERNMPYDRRGAWTRRLKYTL